MNPTILMTSKERTFFVVFGLPYSVEVCAACSVYLHLNITRQSSLVCKIGCTLKIGTLKRINYMSYVDKLNLRNAASLLKLNFQMDDIIRSNATIFVGTMPELEMALYTIYFYTKLNNECPVSLGGTKFNIYTYVFMYFGDDVIDDGLPLF